MAPRKKTNGNGINGNGSFNTSFKEMDVTTVENANQAFEAILAVVPQPTIDEAVLATGATHVALLNWFSDRLPEEPVRSWDTIPSEYAPLLDEFKQVWDAEQSIRKLSPESSAQHFQVPIEVPEIPLIEDEPIPQPESTAIAKPSRLTKAEQAKLTQETVVLNVNESKKAKQQRRQKQDANAVNRLQQLQREGQLEGVTEVLAKVSAKEEVLNAFEDKTAAEDTERSDTYLQNFNQRLKDAGIKFQVVSDEELTEKHQEFIDSREAHQDFLSTIASIW